MNHPLYRITHVEYLQPYSLRISFDDGLIRTINFEPILDGEIYGPLSDPAAFAQVAIDPEIHTVVWPCGADFDPATLHDWPDHEAAFPKKAENWRHSNANEIIHWQPLLLDALAILAAAPDEQIRANGPGCIACDLPEEFEHAWRVTVTYGAISESQRDSLDKIDAHFRAMSDSDRECGNDDVLWRPAWQEMRDLAKQALALFGWDSARAEPMVEIEPGHWRRPPSAV